jgi:hypothetical protein
VVAGLEIALVDVLLAEARVGLTRVAGTVAVIDGELLTERLGAPGVVHELDVDLAAEFRPGEGVDAFGDQDDAGILLGGVAGYRRRRAVPASGSSERVRGSRDRWR